MERGRARTGQAPAGGGRAPRATTFRISASGIRPPHLPHLQPLPGSVDKPGERSCADARSPPPATARPGVFPAPNMARTAAAAPLARAVAVLLLGLLLSARPAAAQLGPAGAGFPIGESHRVEILGTLWSPASDLTAVSRVAGASGATRGAAGVPDAAVPRFTDLRLRLRLRRRHRIHVEHLPVRYPAATTLDRVLAVEGVAFEPGPPVASTLTWKTWRLAYEYDVFHGTRGSLGLLMEARYTDLEIAIDGACGTAAACGLTRTRRPIPAGGGVLRLYPSPVILIAAEASVLRMPGAVGDYLGYAGELLDYDVYAALNFIRAFGLQVGYRSRRLNLRAADQDADLRLEGVYVGALLRF